MFLGKLVKLVTDFKAKMHQIRFLLGSASESDPTGELTVRLQTPWLYLRGLLLRGEGGRGRGKKRGRKGKGVEGKRRWSEGFGLPKNFGVAPTMMQCEESIDFLRDTVMPQRTVTCRK